MSDYKVKYGQTIYDIATQKYGQVDGIAQILIDNPNIVIENKLSVDQNIIISDDANNVINRNVVNFFSGKTITNFDQFSVNDLTYFSNFGVISTQNKKGYEYIDSSVWRYDSAVYFTKSNIDRIYLENEKVVGVGSDNKLEIQFSLSSLTDSDTVIAHSLNKSRVYVESNEIKISTSSGTEVSLSLPQTASIDALYTLEIWLNSSTELNVVLNGVTYLGTLLESDNEFSFDILGGTTDTRGIDGYITYIRDKDYVFNFIEGSGNMVVEKSLHNYFVDLNGQMLVDSQNNILVG